MRRPVRAAGAARHRRAGQVPVRQGHRGAQRQEVADRARVLQAGHRNLHAEPVSARRQARHRRHLSRRRHAPRRSCWRSTSSGSSCRSTRPTPAPTTRSTSSGMAHFRQMRAPQRDQTETREAIKEFEAFVARYPNSSLMPEVQDQAARGARSAERVGLSRRLLLLPPALVSRRDRSLQGAAEGGPRVHRPRRASTSTSPSRW